MEVAQSEARVQEAAEDRFGFHFSLVYFLCFLPVKEVRKPPPEAVRHHDWLSQASTMPQMLQICTYPKHLKCEQ